MARWRASCLGLLLFCAIVCSGNDGNDGNKGPPRVALMFLTRGTMPLESAWRKLLEGVKDLQPPPLSGDDMERVMDVREIRNLRKQMDRAGSLVANTVLQDSSCVDDKLIKEAAKRLHASKGPRIDKGESPRGVMLKNTTRSVGHPIYQQQSLFSIYVHTHPDFEGFPEESLFYGREITPSIAAPRFSHALSEAGLLLVESALNDPAVDNAQFVMISEADLPLYNGAALYLQLIMERRTRVGTTQTFESLLSRDQEAASVSPFSFVPPVTKDFFGKGSQWITLTRSVAFMAVHDQIIEPWFASFGGTRWRCRFLEEGRQVMDAVNVMQQHGLPIPSGNLVIRLFRRGLLPANFSQGELLSGLLPGDNPAPPKITKWERFTERFKPPPPPPAGALMDTQQEALTAHRTALRTRTPHWAYLRSGIRPLIPLNDSASSVTTTTNEVAEQIWDGLLSGNRQGRRMLSFAPHSPYTLLSRLAHKLLSKWWPSRLDQLRSPQDSSQHLRPRVGRGLQESMKPSARKEQGPAIKSFWKANTWRKSQRIERLAQEAPHFLPEDDEYEEENESLKGIPQSVLDTVREKRTGITVDNIQRRLPFPPGPDITLDMLLHRPYTADETAQRGEAYGSPWPLPSGSISNVVETFVDWREWSIEMQWSVLMRVFPQPASRVVNVVSDEGIIKTMMNFYNMTGEEWQTESYSHHVDWGRATASGSPGSYPLVALQFDPTGIRQMLRGQTCDDLTNGTYVAAHKLFTKRSAPVPSEGLFEYNPAFHQIWNHSPLPDNCLLFARKFEAGTVPAIPQFFNNCSQIGYDHSCLGHAVRSPSEAFHGTDRMPGMFATDPNDPSKRAIIKEFRFKNADGTFGPLMSFDDVLGPATKVGDTPQTNVRSVLPGGGWVKDRKTFDGDADKDYLDEDKLH